MGAAACLAAAPVARALEVVICESHHRVLAYWLAAAETGLLPRHGVSVVHFDGHPDLAVPVEAIPREWPARPDDLVRRVDIASFQLAAVWIGLVERIVWLRPAWAGVQFPDGERRFRIGTVGGKLRADDDSDFYVLDGAWAPPAALRDAVPVRLQVMPLDPAVAALAPAQILDIDLDGFATRNPGADELRRAGFSEADLTTLRRIFAREHLALAADPATRISELDAILAALRALAAGSLSELPGAAYTLWQAGIGVRDLLALHRILASDRSGLGVDRLLEDGRQLVGLPEQGVPPTEEILETARLLARLAGERGVRPVLVTVARSVADGFTPRDGWPDFEWALLLALREEVGEYRVRLDAGVGPAPRPSRIPLPAAPAEGGEGH